MKINSRSLALVLALISVSVGAALLNHFVTIHTFLFWSVVGANLVFQFFIFFLVLEKLVFKDLRKISQLIPAVNGEEKSEPDDPILDLANDIKSFHRITQKEIEEIQKNAAFRREFIADISHEIKTPLFAAQGFVHTLLDGAVRDKAVRERFLKKAAKNLDGLDILVQDLLSLSQIETGSISVHFEYFDLYELTQEVFEQFESQSQKKDIHLRILVEGQESTEHSRVIVHADSRLIYQVISNLVSNGIKYSKNEGEVQVILAESPNQVTVAVRDQGIGIPPKHQPRIFERFYRVEKSRSKIKDKGGTGLGLAIVKHILEAHNSKISVQSVLEQGSMFSFALRKDPQKSIVKG